MSRSGRFGGNPKKSYGTAQTIQNVVPGRVYTDTKGDWLCITALAAIAQYAWVIYDPTTTAANAQEATTVLAGTATLQVGVSQVALLIGEIGLVWIGGAGAGGLGRGVKGKVATLYAAKANIYTTATSGVADDTATAGVIKNVVGLTTDAGGGSAVELFATGWLTSN